MHRPSKDRIPAEDLLGDDARTEGNALDRASSISLDQVSSFLDPTLMVYWPRHEAADHQDKEFPWKSSITRTANTARYRATHP